MSNICDLNHSALHVSVPLEVLNEANLRLCEALKAITDIRAALDEHSIVAITDNSGKITYVNNKFCALSQYTREELMGKDHRIINSHYHNKEFFRDLWSTITQGKPWRNEIRNRAKDGTFYWVDTTIYPVVKDGRPEQYISIRTDITRRKENEAQLQQLANELQEKNKDLESIVYIIAHDLRTPLAHIQGFGKQLEKACHCLHDHISKLLSRTTSTAEAFEILDSSMPSSLQFIQGGIEKINILLNGFLRFSRTNDVQMQIGRLDMNDLVSEVVDSLENELNGSNAEVYLYQLPECMGDKAMVTQIFSHIIDNAIKYRVKSRCLQISISGDVEGNASLYSITDNGRGIATDHQATIFEIFHRLDPGEIPGEGLGLAIAQRLLLRLGGKIWVNSQTDKGATFYVSLPRADSPSNLGKCNLN